MKKLWGGTLVFASLFLLSFAFGELITIVDAGKLILEVDIMMCLLLIFTSLFSIYIGISLIEE